MLKIKNVFILISTIMTMESCITKHAENSENYKWSIVATIPPIEGQKESLGFAGPVVGVSNNVLIVAGGANFPDGMPWEGASKKYHSEVFVLQKNEQNNFSWKSTSKLQLRNKIAYGTSISLPEGIFCVGGESETGHTSNVFMLQWDEKHQNINYKDYPNLPTALANTAVAHIGNTIYVCGGENGKNAVDSFYSIDISSENPKWKTLPPLPIALSHAVAISQNGGDEQCIYVIGGRTPTASGISDLHSTVFCFHPKSQSWKELGGIKDEKGVTNLSAATAVAFGRDKILIMGGDKGPIFHQIETYNFQISKEINPEKKQNLITEKIKFLNNHPGFSRDVLEYNTQNESWKKVGELPYSPVTTTAVKWDNDIFIPSGEIRAGVRTPNIIIGK